MQGNVHGALVKALLAFLWLAIPKPFAVFLSLICYLALCFKNDFLIIYVCGNVCCLLEGLKGDDVLDMLRC